MILLVSAGIELFLLSSWYSAALLVWQWEWYGQNTDALSFWVLQSLQSRGLQDYFGFYFCFVLFFSSHALPVRRCTKETGREPGQVNQTEQRDIPHHRASCLVYRQGELPRRVVNLSLERRVQHHGEYKVSMWWTIALSITFLPGFLFPFYYY